MKEKNNEALSYYQQPLVEKKNETLSFPVMTRQILRLLEIHELS